MLETEEASAQVYVSFRINNGLLQHSERPGGQLSYPGISDDKHLVNFSLLSLMQYLLSNMHSTSVLYCTAL